MSEITFSCKNTRPGEDMGKKATAVGISRPKLCSSVEPVSSVGRFIHLRKIALRATYVYETRPASSHRLSQIVEDSLEGAF